LKNAIKVFEPLASALAFEPKSTFYTIGVMTSFLKVQYWVQYLKITYSLALSNCFGNHDATLNITFFMGKTLKQKMMRYFARHFLLLKKLDLFPFKNWLYWSTSARVRVKLSWHFVSLNWNLVYHCKRELSPIDVQQLGIIGRADSWISQK
jgi:hypothetical protein